MLQWLGIIGNILGIGESVLKKKAELKQLQIEQEHEIIKAQTKAAVDRIMSNTDSDNAIDLITARNKKYTWKDEVITYLFLVPIIIATVTPFIQAFKSSEWLNLSTDIRLHYENLDNLPEWYKWVVILIVVDVLGFRSFMRKVVDNAVNKYINKSN